MPDITPSRNRVGANLPLKVSVFVWSPCILTPNHPTTLEWPNGEPIYTGNYETNEHDWRPSTALEITEHTSQHHECKDEMQTEPKHRTASVAKMVTIGL